jgi:hypothetical protein
VDEAFSGVSKEYRGCFVGGLRAWSTYLMEMCEDEKTTRLPPGYRLDLVGDPCVIVLVREDGTVVARFTHNADPEEVSRAVEEDRRTRGGG